MQDDGAVNVIYGDAAGLTAEGNQIWSRSSADISPNAGKYDHFGYSLAP